MITGLAFVSSDQVIVGCDGSELCELLITPGLDARGSFTRLPPWRSSPGPIEALSAVAVNPASGAIWVLTSGSLPQLFKAHGNTTIQLPDFLRPASAWSWDDLECRGLRSSGMSALSFTPDGLHAVSTSRWSLFQDGGQRSGSGWQLRLHFWRTTASKHPEQLVYSRSYRYATSPRPHGRRTGDRGDRDGVVGLAALTASSLLLLESEDDAATLVYHVEVAFGEDVDGCVSLLKCPVGSPRKRLIHRADGRATGFACLAPSPASSGGPTRCLLAVSVGDTSSRLIELSVNASALRYHHPWEPSIGVDDGSSSRLLAARRVALAIGGATSVVVLCLLTYLRACARRAARARASDRATLPPPPPALPPLPHLWQRRYVLATVVLNAAVLGGAPFGYAAAALMFKKEGLFSSGCSCGGSCDAQEERLARVSTLGFAATIGCRLIWGKLLDRFGPKLTCTSAGLLVAVGFLLCASASDDAVIAGWTLAAAGGGGVHVAGFHVSSARTRRLEPRQAIPSGGIGADLTPPPCPSRRAQTCGGARKLCRRASPLPSMRERSSFPCCSSSTSLAMCRSPR